jgi:DNA-binding NarL/FixJ family response regulator
MTVKQPLGCLTPREREVAELIARGYSNQQIASELVLTRGTVANHVAHVLAKLGATNRTQVAARVLSGSEHTHSEADPLMNEPQSALVAD